VKLFYLHISSQVRNKQRVLRITYDVYVFQNNNYILIIFILRILSLMLWVSATFFLKLLVTLNFIKITPPRI
jgi:hypothetical protein